MKKLFLSISLFIFATTSSYAGSGQVERIFNADVVAGTGTTVMSRTFDVSSIDRLGVWTQAGRGASVGSTIRFDMVMQGSYTDTSSKFATMSTIGTWADTSASASTITTPAMKYIRFYTKSTTGNATDTTVTAYLFSQDR